MNVICTFGSLCLGSTASVLVSACITPPKRRTHRQHTPSVYTHTHIALATKHNVPPSLIPFPAFQTEGKLYLVLEFLRGGDLFTRLSKEVSSLSVLMKRH